MSSNIQPLGLVQATMNLVAAYVGKSDEKFDPDRILALMSQFHGAAVQLAQSGMPAGGATRLDDAFQPQRLAGPAMRDMPEAARSFLLASSAHLGGDMPLVGAHLDEFVWKGVPEDTRVKFKKLIADHNISIGPNGYPTPRRPLERLISEDQMQVADPITGEYHTMLKRHLRVAHDLDHEELLAMFGLSEHQLPRSGPRYSAAKAEQARRTGLGRTKRQPEVVEAVEVAPPAKTASRKRERTAA